MAVVSAVTALHAETWFFDAAYAKANNVAYPFGAKSGASDGWQSAWTNSVGTRASSFDKEVDVLVVSHGVQCTWTGNSTSFPAKSLQIGEEDGSASGILYHKLGTLKGANLVWNNGTIVSATYKDEPQPWAVTVKGSEKGTEHVWCYASGTSKNNAVWGREGAFIGNENQEVNVKLTSDGCTVDPKESVQLFTFSGNSENWLGKFTVSDCANFVLGHANAAGSPNVAREDTITLGSHARFAVKTGVLLNSSRGIKIIGEDVRFLAQKLTPGNTDCTDYTLNMPIVGDYGFTKKGDGRIVIGGSYAAGAIVVEGGTLEILASAAVKSGTEITVRSGATLVCHFPLSNLAITAEEGAIVRRVVDHTVVPFDTATISATPVAVASDVFDATNVLEFSLSEAIPLPQHEAKEFTIMTYTGSKTLSAEMIVDKTDKAYGLPKTSVSVMSENGLQSIRLKTYPVIVSVADINGSTLDINGAAETWSDGLPPHSGADYVLVNKYTAYPKVGLNPFTGDSLTIAGDIDSSNAEKTKFILSNGEPVTVCAPMSFSQDKSLTYAKQELDISGKIRINGTYGDENAFKVNNIFYDSSRIKGTNRGYVNLSADLTGSGTLALTSGRIWALDGLLGDNSGYTGRIVAYSGSGSIGAGSNKDSLSKGMRVYVTNAENFGGRLDEFRFDAFTLKDMAFLYVADDLSLVTDMNRGLYVTSAGVECSAGVKFTCAWPIRLGGVFSKIGEGTLRIAGPISYGADGNGETGTMQVRAGCLSVLSDASVAGLEVVFSNATTFAVSPDLSTGLTVAPTVQNAPNGSVGTVNLTIDVDEQTASVQNEVSATVATLPPGSSDISSMFTLPRRVFRYTVFRLEKKTVEKDSGSYDVYELKACVKGTVICVR